MLFMIMMNKLQIKDCITDVTNGVFNTYPPLIKHIFIDVHSKMNIQHKLMAQGYDALYMVTVHVRDSSGA